jgi:hypothetical protein
MQKSAGVLAILGAAVLAAACSDSDARLATMTPSPLALTSASVSATPSAVAAQLVGNPSCPGLPPFRAQFHLNVQAGDERAMLITDVRARFQDTSSFQVPMVTLPAPVPTAQFGSMLVEARSARSFPIVIGLGCGGVGRTGTIVVIVDWRDDGGRRHSMQTSVVVR